MREKQSTEKEGPARYESEMSARQNNPWPEPQACPFKQGQCPQSPCMPYRVGMAGIAITVPIE